MTELSNYLHFECSKLFSSFRGDGSGEKVLVVSICGKTPMHSGGAKRIPLHELVGKIIFERAACRRPDLDEIMVCGAFVF